MLRHSSDAERGITRKRMGRYWAYFDANGARITDRGELDRLNSIGLPPAYTDAWFCADANGHLQATGIDARGRKQYRYHPDFREKRDSAKYEGLLEFGKALPRVRRCVERDLRRRSLTREAVLAAVVRLLDTEHIRMRVWERGVGVTLACGTGACATAVAAIRRGLTGRKVELVLDGGSLGIEWREEDGHVLMTGPTAMPFRGRVDLDKLA